MNIDPLMRGFQHLEDTMQTVTASHAKNRKEHLIVLGMRKVRDILINAIEKLEKFKQATHDEIQKIKGLLASSIKITNALLSQIKNLDTISDPMQLIQHALAYILKPQAALLSKL